MDSDKILLMDAGSVKEYDHPYVLLQKEHGLLRTLVNTTGANTSKNLENIAREVSYYFQTVFGTLIANNIRQYFLLKSNKIFFFKIST